MEVRLVRNARELRAFVDLPYRLHAGDPQWVPPLRMDMRQRLSRKRNPFFEHGEADYFLALREGRVVGRVAAVANRLHDQTHGDGTAFFGFFESRALRIAPAEPPPTTIWLRITSTFRQPSAI